MNGLLSDIFDLYFLGEHYSPNPELWEQENIVSQYHDQITTALGQEFSEQLWRAHSQLSEIELRDAFSFGAELAVARLTSAVSK